MCAFNQTLSTAYVSEDRLILCAELVINEAFHMIRYYTCIFHLAMI